MVTTQAIQIEYQADDVQDSWDKLSSEELQKIEEETKEIERLIPIIPPPSSPDDEFDYSSESDLIHISDDDDILCASKEISMLPEPEKTFIEQKAKPEPGASIFSIMSKREANPINIDYVLNAALKGERLPERDFILPGLLKRTVGYVAGGGSTGKTMYCLQTAISLSAGIDIFKLYARELVESDFDNDEKPWVMKERKVAYVSLEDDEETIMYRIHSIITFIIERKELNDPRYKNVDLSLIADKIKQNMKIFDLSGFGSAGWLAGPQITDQQRLKRELDIIKTCRDYDIIFIDTLRRNHGFGETDDSGANTLIGSAERIARECNAAIIFLCHTTKEASLNGLIDAESIRGSSVYKDNGRWATVISGVGIQRDSNNKRIKVDERIRVKYVRHGIPKANHIKSWPEGWLERGKGGVLFRTTDDVDEMIASNTPKREDNKPFNNKSAQKRGRKAPGGFGGALDDE